MLEFTYPVVLTPDEDDGGFVVTFPDIPEAITQGDTVEECLSEAEDCLDEAIAACVDDGRGIPTPSAPAAGQHTVALPAQMTLKAAIYLAIKEEGITKTELGRRIGVTEKEARRILDPRHGTKLATLEKALSALGKRIILKVA